MSAYSLYRRRSPLALALALTVSAAGCKQAGKEAAEPKEKKTQEKKAAATKEAPATERTDSVCMAAWSTEGEAKTLEAGERTFERKGTWLSEKSKDDDAVEVVGVLANIKEDTEKNLANIERALEFFDEHEAGSIVVVGDLGETESQIVNGLEPIAATGLPVFTIIGNREKKSDYAEALKTVREKHPNVVDLNQVRLAELDDAALISIPGYYDPAYLHAAEGCQYTAADLAASEAIVDAIGEARPAILVSHGPPKQEGTEALDRTLEQANVGDPNLSKFIQNKGVKLGVFANIQEAGGRGTDLTGKNLVPPGEMTDTLFLNPGAIDSVSWKMNDGTRSAGMAAVLTVKDGKAKYDVFKIEDEG